MSIGKLINTAIDTGTGVVRVGWRTASWAVGVAKGAADAGVAAAREGRQQSHARPAARTGTATDEPAAEAVRPPAAQKPEKAEKPERSGQPEDPRDRIPGPDVVAPQVPRAEDLPEPVVIEADDAAGESFQTEPKAAGRDSEHGGPAGDREEAEGYAEEVVDTTAPEVDTVTPVGTTGADVGTNPDTAESDLQQPGTPPLNDPAALKAVRSETETLRAGAQAEGERED